MFYPADEKVIERFIRIMNCWLTYNKKVNLTAITEPDEVAVKHFLDSVSLCGVCAPKPNASI